MLIDLLKDLLPVLCVILGAILGHVLTRKRERLRTLDERRFDVYMRLMDLDAAYFWYVSYELRGEPVPPKVREQCYELATQLIDKLRAIDDDAQVEDALDVLFRIDYANTADDRSAKLAALIERMGQTVNPRYAKKMRQISAANVKAMAAGAVSNAPGAKAPWF